MINTLRHLFTPHHTNNHRPRILHPAGMAVMIAFALLFHSSIELVKVAPPKGYVLGYASDINVNQVLEQTNQERVLAGLPPMKLNQSLSQAAVAKANNMFTNNYWAHISPEGKTPWEFIKATGYKYSVAGENLARDFNDTPTMVKAWMDSPTHKANIVHSKYEETGIAVVNGKLDGLETTLVVQMFGKPVAGIIPKPQISQEGAQVAPELATVEPQALEQPNVVPLTQPVVLSQESPEITKTYISPIDLKKSAVLAVVILIMVVLTIDELIIQHKKTVRFVGRNIAHLSFFAIVVLIIITVTQQGGIL